MAKKRAKLKRSKRAKLAAKAREQAELGEKNYGIAFNVEQGGRMYAPSRDFAYNYPQMVKSVINCFSQDYWPQLYTFYVEMWAKHAGVAVVDAEANNNAFDELEQAKDVFCAFLNKACEDKQQNCDDALKEVGWDGVPVAAQITWLAMLGQVITGQLFQGIRDLQKHPGEKPIEIEEMLAAGHDARRAMNGIDSATEQRKAMQRRVRQVTRDARAAGLTFDEVGELVDDIKFGRVPADE